jgi:hypothetical protein
MASLASLCVSVIASARGTACVHSFVPPRYIFSAGAIRQPCGASQPSLSSRVCLRSYPRRRVYDNHLSRALPSSVGSLLKIKVVCVVVPSVSASTHEIAVAAHSFLLQWLLVSPAHFTACCVLACPVRSCVIVSPHASASDLACAGS